jgi:tetratricopeptide (TPR) repeat protein
MGKLGKLGLMLASCAVAVPIYYGWRASRPREIRVCAVTDYAFRQRPNWEQSMGIRLGEANRIFNDLKVVWKLVGDNATIDPTAAGGSLDQRRASLDDALTCEGDVRLSYTGVQAGRRSGSVNPFSRSMVVVDRPDKSDVENGRVLAHSLAGLFGAQIEPQGSNTIMTEPPESDTFSVKSAALIRALRDYNFAAGIGALTPVWITRILKALPAAMPDKITNPVVQANRVIATSLANERRMEQAVPYLREALKLEPGNALLRAELAGALVQLSQGPEALKEITEAIRTSPNDPTLRAVYANVLAKTGDSEAGVDELQKAVEMQPSNLLFRLSLGASLIREAGRVDESIAVFKEAVKVEPNSPVATAALERAEYQKQIYTEDAAKRRVEAAQPPVTFGKLFVLASAEMRAGNLDAAAKAFERAVEMDKSSGRARAGLAVVRYLRKEYAAAWREVKASRAANFEPPASLVAAIRRKQPE